MLKRYPCHATAHAAVRAVRDLQAEHRFSGDEIEAITVTGNRRMIERHNILEPSDLMLAQYSIPFCVALALYREARDPESYDDSALADPRIRALTRKVRWCPKARAHGGLGSTLTVTLADGRRFERHENSGLLEAGRTGRQIYPPDPRRFRQTARRRALRPPGTAQPNPTSRGSALLRLKRRRNFGRRSERSPSRKRRQLVPDVALLCRPQENCIRSGRWRRGRSPPSGFAAAPTACRGDRKQVQRHAAAAEFLQKRGDFRVLPRPVALERDDLVLSAACRTAALSSVGSLTRQVIHHAAVR